MTAACQIRFTQKAAGTRCAKVRAVVCSRKLCGVGFQSTFVKALIGQTEFQVEIYRDDSQGGPYVLTETLKLELPGSSS